MHFDEQELDVNQHGVLRIPLELWLAAAFLCRHWVLALLMAVSVARMRDVQALLGPGLSVPALGIELPALVFAGLCAFRVPSAERWIRILWPRARWFALATVALHVVFAGYALQQSTYWQLWPELFLVSCALIDVAIALAITRPGHLRNVLAEFPESQPNPEKS